MLVSPAAARKSEWRKHRLVRPAIPPPRRCRRPVGAADEHAAVRSPWATDPAPHASQPRVVFSRSSSPTDKAAAKNTSEPSAPTQQQSTRNQPPHTGGSASVHRPPLHDVQGMSAEGSGGGVGARTPVSGCTVQGRNRSGHRSGHCSGTSTSPVPKAVSRDDAVDGARRNRVRGDCGAAVAASEAANESIAQRAITGAYGETSTHPRWDRQLDSAGPAVSQLPQGSASLYVDAGGHLTADDDGTDGEALSQTSDPVEDSEAQSVQRTSAAENRGTADATKPMERLSTLKQMIRVPKLPPAALDLSKFQLPKPVEKGKRKFVRKYRPVADGFVGSELSVPSKLKRVRRVQRSRAPQAGGLELVQGGLQALDQSAQTEVEMRGMSSLHDLGATPRKRSEDLFGDGVVVSLLDSPGRSIRTTPSHPRYNENLRQEQGQRDRADRDVSIGWHGSQPSTRRNLIPTTAFQMARDTAPVRPDTVEEEDGGEEEEIERPREMENHESVQKAGDGSSSEAGSSSDSTTGDGAYVADAGSPLVERAGDNTYEGSPDILSASGTISDRIRSTPKHSRREPALGQHDTSASLRESQYRGGLGNIAVEMTRPGQAARMQSSGMWMEVQEEIESTPPTTSRLLDNPEDRKKRVKSVISSEALVPEKRQLVAAAMAVPVPSRQRTGQGTAEDSGNSSRRYTTYPKECQQLELIDHTPEGVSSFAESAFRHPAQTPIHSSTGVIFARNTVSEGRKSATRRRSRIMVSGSTRDYFSAAQRKLFATDDEQLAGDHISPVTNGNGVGAVALSTQTAGFANNSGFAHPYVRDEQYSQRRRATQGAADSTQPRFVGTVTVTDGGRLPSLLLDPPFLQ